MQSDNWAKRAKDEGKVFTAGVSINNLSLNENDIGDFKTFLKLSPPLRREEDRETLVQGLKDKIVDVIVSDGFTGNVALKTAEGTANFITSELKKALNGNLIGKISSLLNISNLKKFKKRLDPRHYNGAIFIGLDSPVVKSHGGTDFIGFSNSLDVCSRIIKGNLIEKIKNNI